MAFKLKELGGLGYACCVELNKKRSNDFAAESSAYHIHAKEEWVSAVFCNP
ncbi:MAG: hypothetical protein HQM14_21200 [SAR324 cluster bacterium]|nr:hypothetical protein [SAR324 cluster bacterium]